MGDDILKKPSRLAKFKLKFELSIMKGRYSELLEIEYENGGLTPEEQTEYDTLLDRIAETKALLPVETVECATLTTRTNSTIAPH